MDSLYNGRRKADNIFPTARTSQLIYVAFDFSCAYLKVIILSDCFVSEMVLFIAFRDLPLSILIGIPLVTVCYVLVNIAYLAVLTPAEIKISSAVAVVSSSNLRSQHLLEGESCSIFLAAYCNENVARHIQYCIVQGVLNEKALDIMAVFPAKNV